MLIRQGEKIVFFGDSLTQRTDLNESEHPARRYSLDYAGSYVDILVKRLLIHFPQLEFTFYNRGVGGDTIRHLLERYSHDIAPLHPTMMILWIGQNDARRPTRRALNRGCAACWSGAGRIRFRRWCSPPPPHRSHEKMVALKQVDNILRRVSGEKGLPFIDVKSPDAGGDGA